MCCSTGAGMDRLRSHSVLCEGDYRRDPARRGPQRPRVVWRRRATGILAWGRDHVSGGQCLQPLLVRRPV